MKSIKAKYEILDYPKDALQRIEKAARTCYKSEDRITEDSAEKLVRMLLKREHYAMIEFGGNVVVKFYSNRGFTHELVRHRLASYAQESTRYCNYKKGKFGGEITTCLPLDILADKFWDDTKVLQAQELMDIAWEFAERKYLQLIDMGVPAEIAREVLPIGLKAEIVISANVREWRHIFNMRYSPKAHPRMREVMRPLLAELQIKIPVIFDDISFR